MVGEKREQYGEVVLPDALLHQLEEAQQHFAVPQLKRFRRAVHSLEQPREDPLNGVVLRGGGSRGRFRLLVIFLDLFCLLLTRLRFRDQLVEHGGGFIRDDSRGCGRELLFALQQREEALLNRGTSLLAGGKPEQNGGKRRQERQAGRFDVFSLCQHTLLKRG